MKSENNMRITVCEISNNEASYADIWNALQKHTVRDRTDLLLLPEFAFLPAIWERNVSNPDEWNALIQQSEQIFARLPQLKCGWVIGAAPAIVNGKLRNLGFAWSDERGVVPLRSKAYMPDEPGNWERTWFDAGPDEFPAYVAGPLRFGMNICTELWALDAIARYPSLAVQAVMTPRATASATTERWMNLAKTVAVRIGAFSISSNRRHADGSCGGVGWIINPEGAEVARTSESEPFVTRELDLAESTSAQATYPRYIFAGEKSD